MSNNTNKIIQSLVFIASKMEDKTVDVMKAYKLLWLADRCHLRMYGRTITGDKYYALPMGLVPTDAKHILDGVSISPPSIIIEMLSFVRNSSAIIIEFVTTFIFLSDGFFLCLF